MPHGEGIAFSTEDGVLGFGYAQYRHVGLSISYVSDASFCHAGNLTVRMANTKKVALITGANKGLGLEMARQLGRAGVTVVLAARDPQKGEAAAAKLRSEGFDTQPLKLDVTDQKDHAAAAAFLNEKFGRLDILINNAGISVEGLGGGKVSTTTEDVIHRTFET